MPDSLFLDVTANGIFASHPERAELPAKVASTTPDLPGKHNTLRTPLITVGCWGVPDALFDFDSSFVKPETAPGITKLGQLRDRLADKQTKEKPPLSIFGHADPVGQDDYNKKLSGRRARALYGALIRSAAVWEALYQEPLPGDDWKTTHVLDRIRVALERPPGGPDSKDIRHELFESYMDLLRGDLNLTAADFLAQGSGKDGKGDLQGCSSFNPIFLISAKEEKEFANATGEKKDQRDALNAVNRRVLVFLFKPGTRIDATKWPCPSVQQSHTGCVSRFWSDGDPRRKKRLPNARREYQKVAVDVDTGEEVGTEPEETFACRFYYGISLHSPCEGGLKIWPLRLLLAPPKAGTDGNPLANRRFVVKAGEDEEAPLIRGVTGDKGELFVPLFDEHTTMVLKVDVKPSESDEVLASPLPNPPGQTPADPDAWPGEDRFLTYNLDAGALVRMKDQNDQGAKQRLYNLGYGPAKLEDWDKDPAKPSDLKQAQDDFRRDQGLAADTDIKDALAGAYGG